MATNNEPFLHTKEGFKVRFQLADFDETLKIEAEDKKKGIWIGSTKKSDVVSRLTVATELSFIKGELESYLKNGKSMFTMSLTPVKISNEEKLSLEIILINARHNNPQMTIFLGKLEQPPISRLMQIIQDQQTDIEELRSQIVSLKKAKYIKNIQNPKDFTFNFVNDNWIPFPEICGIELITKGEAIKVSMNFIYNGVGGAIRLRMDNTITFPLSKLQNTNNHFKHRSFIRAINGVSAGKHIFSIEVVGLPSFTFNGESGVCLCLEEI